MKELRSQSFHSRDIVRLLHDGVIEKVKPGLYRLKELEESIGPMTAFIDVCNAIPQGIICLASALSFYDLTTFNPPENYVAIPNSSKPHKIQYPPTKFFYFRDRFYKPGMTKIKTTSGDVRIYDIEKTVCDMFRYRNKLGLDLALEGLRNYLQLKDANINKLRRYAEICQVKTVMLPFVRAIAR